MSLHQKPRCPDCGGSRIVRVLTGQYYCNDCTKHINPVFPR